MYNELDGESLKTRKEETIDLLSDEADRVNKDIDEIRATLEASEVQIEQLAQRSATLMGEVQRIQASIDQIQASQVRDLYAEAMDAQQRLAGLRGQADKLRAQEAAAEQQITFLSRAIEILEMPDPGEEDVLSSKETIIRILDATEEERRRLSRQMHDGPAHSLTNFILQAEIVQRLFEKKPEKAKEELSNLKQSASDAFQLVRRFIFDLHPMILSDLGLIPAVKRYADSFRDKTGVQTELRISGRERRFEDYREVLIFRAMQDIMLNAVDHGGASAINIDMDANDDVVRVVVEDDGRGLGTGRLSLDRNANTPIGLSTLQERLALVGGRLEIDKGMSRGSRVEIIVPSGPEPELDTAIAGLE
ncbi:MAG: hypothetical protein GYB68_17325 [Chloroflexi bacterium]|nr:hypothetical protein [Chloroflexota bacterium]